MRVLLSAGGTREPIDAVRVLGNLSTGRLGARLAEALVARGHAVTWLHGMYAERPQVAVHEVGFDTSSELQAALALHAPGQDAVLHAAAVADYLPLPATGKLASDAPELVLRLRRAPKLVDGLRALAPAALLCGFKLTAGAAEVERIAAGQRLLQRARLDLVLVNDAGQLDEQGHAALLLDARGVRGRARGKLAVAALLVDALEALHPARSAP